MRAPARSAVAARLNLVGEKIVIGIGWVQVDCFENISDTYTDAIPWKTALVNGSGLDARLPDLSSSAD